MRLDDPQLLAAMARLHHDPDFSKFMTLYVSKLLEQQVQSCIESDSPARSQGGAQILQEIIQDVAGAEEAYHKITKREIPLL